jgi:hypothetical protein
MKIGQPKLPERGTQESGPVVTSLHQGPHRAIDDYGLKSRSTRKTKSFLAQFMLLQKTPAFYALFKKGFPNDTPIGSGLTKFS